MPDLRDLTISIVTFHTDLDVLKRCLASLSVALKHLNSARVFIVDNSDAAYSISLTEMLKQRQLAVNVIAGHGNVGYGAANNLAIKQSDGRFHLVLNPDTFVTAVALKNALQYMAANESTVMVGAVGFDETGGFLYLNRRTPTLFVLLLRGFAPSFIKSIFSKQLHHYEMREVDWKSGPVEVEVVSGAFMFCRTAPLKAIGGFDEKYFLYFEDYALSRAMRSKGKLLQLPNVQITHLGGNTSRKGLKHIKMFMQSARTFFLRD